MKYIYVIQQIDLIEGEPIAGIVVGAFTELRFAKISIKELREKERSKKVLYDLVTVQANTIPTTTDQNEEAIYDLIDRGLMEPLVGEDGHFHYVLTDEGKKKAKEIINKLEKKDKENDETGGEEGID